MKGDREAELDARQHDGIDVHMGSPPETRSGTASCSDPIGPSRHPGGVMPKKSVALRDLRVRERPKPDDAILAACNQRAAIVGKGQHFGAGADAVEGPE